MGWIILGTLSFMVLLVPVGYFLFPVYAIYRPKNFQPSLDRLYVGAIWAAGLIPILSLLAFAVTQHIPSLQSRGGEPGLNFGYDVVALAVGLLLTDASHVTVWVLLVASSFMRCGTKAQGAATS
jgi:hypothetical protein